MKQRDEFELINALFAPLAVGFPGSLGLKDDAALLDPPAGHSVVISTDAVVAGVHFRCEDSPDLVARKLVRVNLSDLASMGAKPWVMLIAAAFSDSNDENWINRFAAGLGCDSQQFGIHLIGGDTVATLGPSTFSMTVCGLVVRGQALCRSGARPGDVLYLTGTLGDSALGLSVLTGQLSFGDNEPGFSSYLIDRYYLPRPRLDVGSGLVGLATACIDISDGLLQDLSHLCHSSGVGAQIAIHRLPLSPPAAAALKLTPVWREMIVAGGDDYELLFTAPPRVEEALEQLAKALATPITAVGTVISGNDIVVLDSEENVISFPKFGYRHFPIKQLV